MTVSCLCSSVVVEISEFKGGIKVECVIVAQPVGPGIESWKVLILAGDTVCGGLLRPTWSAIGMIHALNHVGGVRLSKEMRYDAVERSTLDCVVSAVDLRTPFSKRDTH